MAVAHDSGRRALTLATPNGLITTDSRIGNQPDRVYDVGSVIPGFRHKGLARLYERGERRGVAADLVPKVERILARLDLARSAAQMDLPACKLHRLKGEMKGFWLVWVSGNWRIVFRFRGTAAADVDLIDYH